MKLTRHNEKYSQSYTLFGRKNNYNVEIIYNAHFGRFYFYLKDRKSEKSYYSAHHNIDFNDEESCINACVKKLDEMVKL